MNIIDKLKTLGVEITAEMENRGIDCDTGK